MINLQRPLMHDCRKWSPVFHLSVVRHWHGGHGKSRLLESNYSRNVLSTIFSAD